MCYSHKVIHQNNTMKRDFLFFFEMKVKLTSLFLHNLKSNVLKMNIYIPRDNIFQSIYPFLNFHDSLLANSFFWVIFNSFCVREIELKLIYLFNNLIVNPIL
jgi:hypothetical protein